MILKNSRYKDARTFTSTGDGSFAGIRPREISTIAGVLEHVVSQGERLDQVITKYRVWHKRKPLVTAALRRHNNQAWLNMLQRAARLDLMIKGRKTGNVWDELLQLCLLMAGVTLFRSSQTTVLN